MSGSPVLSVIVPTFQRRASVGRVLKALSAQSLPAADYEVVVSIDGSTDGTRELVAGFAAPYRLRSLWQPNAGRAAACNAAIAVSTGPVIVILDDDMEPAPEMLAAHLAAHDSGERVGVLGAVPIRTDDATSPVGRHIAAKFNRHLQRLATGDHIGFRSFYSGNFSIRRELLTEAGLFDEAFRLYGNEDGELALRLLDAGVRLRYEPRALAFQHFEKDFAAVARDSAAKGRTAVLCAGKHPEVAEQFHLRRGKGSRARRLATRGLLALSRASGAVPDAVIGVTSRLERYGRPRGSAYYRLMLGYFYQLGVEAALRGERTAAAPQGGGARRA